MACLIGFLKIWKPIVIWTSPALRTRDDSAATMPKKAVKATREPTTAEVWFSLLPWIIVCVILLLWGTNAVKGILNAYATWNFPVPGLHNMINKVAPVVPAPTKEAAVFSFTWLSYTRFRHVDCRDHLRLADGILTSAAVEGLWRAYSLITISAMLAIGTLTRLSGIDATLGLAFAGTGVLYPFFGTLLGWLGVALTGSDTASNLLFGNLQKITSQQLGLPPILMAAANSSGGVMGKMIDAQSIVVASTATNWFGHEGTILRFVFKHSIALACLVDLLVMLQAYVFTGMIVK
jgi:lactate permease